jgi:phage-related protein
LDPEDNEVRKNTASVLMSKNKNESVTTSTHKVFPKSLDPDRFSHSSVLSCLKRSIVRIQRMIERRRPNKQYNWRPVTGPPTVKELKDAETSIYRSLQRQHFGPEINILHNFKENGDAFISRQSARTRNNKMKHSSSLYRLDPFLDNVGLLRVGGRVRQAEVSLEVKHPLIMPKRSHITELLIQHFHKIEHHQGYGITHNSIRQNGYWIIKCIAVQTN